MGRKLSTRRPRQGAKLASLRRDAGLTQTELARLVGEKQQTIAYWEKSSRPPRSDVLPKLAKVLGVRIDDLINEKPSPPNQRPRPSGGRVQKLFDEVSRLPRRQQDKVVEFVSAFIEQYKRQAS